LTATSFLTTGEKMSEEKLINSELYSGARSIAVKILNRIDRTDAYLDKILDNEMKHSGLKGADKALLFEIVHGVIRQRLKIDYILNSFYKGQFSKCVINIKNALRVALYQIIYLDKVPDYASVNEAVEFIKKVQGRKPADLINAILRNIIRNKEALRYPDPDEDLIAFLSIYYSHPVWMVKRWLSRYGREATESLMTANNERPAISIRVNTLKISVEDFYQMLEKVDLKYIKGKLLPDYLKLKNMSNITDWEYFNKGYFNIQDESAGIACRLLEVKPNMRVLDLCAAPGGKSVYLATLMNNEGEIVAVDKFGSRLKRLSGNLARLGVTNVKVVEADALSYEDEPFDRVLLDAPCSGLGTLSKKPDIKWKRNLTELRNLTKLQYELLVKAASMLKAGGSLVYSTCTIEPEENQEIVKKFVNNNPNYIFNKGNGCFAEDLRNKDGFIQTMPNIHQLDGAFSCRIDRVS